MFKMLKYIAPVILVIFISTSIIAPAFGAEIEKVDNGKDDKIVDVQAEMSLYSYDTSSGSDGLLIERPMTGELFKADLKVWGKGNQITDVSLVNGAFALIDSFKEQDSSPWVHRKAFILKAPETAGFYTVTFKCTDKDGDSVLIDKAIEVFQSVLPPEKPGVTAEPSPILPVQPNQPKSQYTYMIQPVGEPQLFPAAQPTPAPVPSQPYPGQAPRQQGGSVNMQYNMMHETHMQVSCGWAMFWLGLIVGVVVMSIIYASSTERATK